MPKSTVVSFEAFSSFEVLAVYSFIIVAHKFLGLLLFLLVLPPMTIKLPDNPRPFIDDGCLPRGLCL